MTKPQPLPVIAPSIPLSMREACRWVLWNLEYREGQSKPWTKIPLQPSGRPASTTDSSTWTTYSEAWRAYASGQFAGIGFVFAAGDNYVGVDLDHCRHEDGTLEPWAEEIVRELQSYTEIRPSGTGVHIIVRGVLPEGRRRKDPIEMYSEGRYFTVTGHSVQGAPKTVEDRTAELATIHSRVFADATERAERHPEPAKVLFEDAEVLERALRASNGYKVRALWEGDKGHYPSASEAEAALAAHLWFWSGDREQVKRLLPQSGLARQKTERPDYLERTLDLVCKGPGYDPALHSNGRGNHYDTGVIQTVGHGKRPEPQWPKPLEPEALYGLAGDIVRAIQPHTETDPAAILVSFLVAYGSAVGAGPHTTVEADRHGANIYAVLVGESSKARKGTSWGQVQNLFNECEPLGWAASRIQKGGLSSAEGVIWAVRDAIEKPFRDKSTGDIKNEVVDEGVKDKRLLVVEPEFSSPLKMQDREGNTLSPLLRKAWDGGTLSTLTKNSPARATGAHVSIIGHITREELRRHLSDTEAGNGYANRFLWVCVKRSKVLPEGGGIADFTDLVPRLRSALAHGRQVRSYVRDHAARQAWAAVYPDLSEGKPGLLGAVTGRAEAQVLRLSLIYALLDESDVIRREHLAAALAVWQYVEESATYIFGDATGDPVADRIMASLRAVAPEGMDRTSITGVFARNVSAGRLDAALTLLLTAKRARREMERPGTEDGRGRAREVWYANG